MHRGRGEANLLLFFFFSVAAAVRACWNRGGFGVLGGLFSVPCLIARQVANPREASPQSRFEQK